MAHFCLNTSAPVSAAKAVEAESPSTRVLHATAFTGFIIDPSPLGANALPSHGIRRTRSNDKVTRHGPREPLSSSPPFAAFVFVLASFDLRMTAFGQAPHSTNGAACARRFAGRAVALVTVEGRKSDGAMRSFE